jgi:ribosome-binding factor A
MSRRTERLNVLFQEELAEIIRSELRDPRVAGIVSITRVDVSPDLESAEVFVSVLGEPQEKASTMNALVHASPFLRRELLGRVRVRRVPWLHFRLDESIEEAAHILDLMKGLER